MYIEELLFKGFTFLEAGVEVSCSMLVEAISDNGFNIIAVLLLLYEALLLRNGYETVMSINKLDIYSES